MKNLIILSLILTLFFSCEKEDISEYMGVAPVVPIINPSDNFPLDSTIWILTNIVKDSNSIKCNDTIIFHKIFYDMIINGDTISNDTLFINGYDKELVLINGNIVSNDSYSYSLHKTMDIGNPYNLTIYGFSPFGNSDAWSTSLNNTFIDEYEIHLTTFKNLSTKDEIKASFKRIK